MEEILNAYKNAIQFFKGPTINSFITSNYSQQKFDNLTTSIDSNNFTNGSDNVHDSSVDYNNLKEFERVVGIVIPTLYSFIVFIGVVGNSFVIFIVFVNRQMRNGTNMLIVNLACTDLLFLLFCVPFTAARTSMTTWPYSYALCAWVNYLQYVTAYSSIWTLVLMAFNRYIAVVFPFYSLILCTVRNTVICIIVVWVVISIGNLFQFNVYDVMEYEFMGESRQACVFIEYARRTASVNYVRAYYSTFVALAYIVPLFIISVLYVFVLKNLWCKNSISNQHQMDNLRSKRRVTRMIAGVIVAFAICWFPVNFFFICTILQYENRFSHNQSTVIGVFFANALMYANSCVNPFLYALFSKHFRQGFIRSWNTFRLSSTARSTN